MTQPLTGRALRWLTITALALALLFVAFTFVFSLLTYNTASSQRAQILSCTTPQGSCYQRGQKQTGAAVASINLVTSAVADCADSGVKGLRPLQDCAAHRLRIPRDVLFGGSK